MKVFSIAAPRAIMAPPGMRITSTVAGQPGEIPPHRHFGNGELLSDFRD
jgi:hypothetical protein